MNQALIESFTKAGGVFHIAPALFLERLKHIKAFVFDWDGVFNNGSKGEGLGSTYSEPDSVGTNLLRFSFWLSEEAMPVFAIITGASNATAISFAKREHFNHVYSKALHKQDAAKHLCNHLGLKMSEICFFFDDVLDISIAREAGLRIFLPRKTGFAFNKYVADHLLSDYTCAMDGGNYGVREACELMMTLNGNFDDVVKNRVAFEGAYENYLDERNAIVPHYFVRDGGKIIEGEGSVAKH